MAVGQKGISHHMKGRNLSERSLKASVGHQCSYVSASHQDGSVGLGEMIPSPLQNPMGSAVVAAKLKRYHPAMSARFEGKDSKSRGELVSKYVPLIKSVAGRLSMKLPPHVDQKDLLSAGIMGLLDAIEKFDETKGVPFKSYAEFRIRGAMLDELRSMDWVPRSVRKNAKTLEEAYRQVEMRAMRPATDHEVARELGIELESFHRLLDQTKGVSIVSEDEIGDLLSNREGGSLWDIYQDASQNDPVSAMGLKELREVIAQTIESLPENERLVVTLYYYEELTMKEIGEVMEYTESRISQLHTKAVIRLRNKIRKYIEADGLPT
jgi:RNA polymerase sigma factor for flagellar operon FliA